MIRVPLLAAIALLCAPALLSLAAAPASVLTADSSTIFLLEADLTTGQLVDRTGHTAPQVKGGSVLADERFGACVELNGSGIIVPDGGQFQFAGGLTLDAWIYLVEPPPRKQAALAVKVGSFAWDLGGGKLNTGWLSFPTLPVATTAPSQFKYHPLNSDTINGLINLPVGQWVHLTVAYDEALGAITNIVDGVVDRHRYRYRGAERLQCDPMRPLSLLEGLPHARVGPIRLQAGRPSLPRPALVPYAHSLPYEGKVLLTLDHIDPALPLPITVTLIWEKPSGPAMTLRNLDLQSYARQDLELEMPTWRNVSHLLMIRATAGGRQVLAQDLRVSTAKPAGNVQLTPDRTIVRDGKPFFPLVIYHAFPEDIPTVAGLGFNVLINDFNLNQVSMADSPKRDDLLQQTLDAAERSHLWLLPAANSTFNKLHTISRTRGYSATLGWYGADEPWGELTKLVDSYNTLKLLDPDLPVVTVQNNYSRLQETAMGADIIGVDPYPIPNVSLREVADATQAAARAVAGRKPVWTVIPQYGAKIPTRDELRAMAWLAIAAGADGLGFFCWDERLRDSATGALKGWYSKEHPEQVEDLRVVVGELRQLEKVLLARPEPKAPSESPANPAIHAALRTSAGRRYLVLASDSRQEETTTLTLAGLDDSQAHCLLPVDGAQLAIRSQAAAISLPPLAVRIYELSRGAQ